MKTGVSAGQGAVISRNRENASDVWRLETPQRWFELLIFFLFVVNDELGMKCRPTTITGLNLLGTTSQFNISNLILIIIAMKVWWPCEARQWRNGYTHPRQCYPPGNVGGNVFFLLLSLFLPKKHQVLSIKPVLNLQSTFSMLACPATGYYESLMRNCPYPCSE